jgi:outer membrane receptor protein involved in Fe transport
MPIKFRNLRTVAFTGVCAAALLASAPQAQAADPAQASAGGKDTDVVAEVIVTAQYKKQDVQHVPVSIVALDGRALEDLGAAQLEDYASTIPGLSFTDRGPNRSNIVIRGISPLTGASAVGIYLDGIEQSNLNNNPDFGLFDIGRIEVLRGPQGTLYGEGSLGGTIRVFTTEPAFGRYETKFEAIGSDTDHGGGSDAFNMVTNLPIGNDAAVRLSGYDHNESGWIDNVANGDKDVNWNHDEGVRGAVKFRVGANLDVQAIVNYQQDRIGLLNVQDPTLGRYKVDRLTDQGENQRATQYTGLANYTALGGTFQEVIGYNDEQDHRGVDSLSTVGIPGYNLYYDAHSKIFTNETRYVSSYSGPFNFVTGFYYKDLSRPVALDLVNGGPLFGLSGDYINAGTTKDTTTAVYGEAYYQITDKLKATAGLRWSTDHIAFPLLTTIGTFVLNNTDLSGNYSATTPKFGLAYQSDANLLFFANIAEGYRPGGVNSIPSASPFYQQTYKPDSAWSYEAGVKSETADHRLRADATVYYIDWKNIQILGEPTNPALGFTTNAGAAHSTGFEAEVTAVPVHGLQFDVGVGYTDPRLDAPAQGLAKGSTLPGVSNWNTTVAGQYEWSLAGDWSGFARADWWYHSHTDTAPEYEVVNLRLGAQNARWGAFLFANNVTNNQEITVTATSGQYVGRPRTIGVDLRAHF